MTMARNSRILRVIPLLATILFLSFPAHAQYGGGSGSADDPYLIYTAEQMNMIGVESNDWDKHFTLMDDIDLSDFANFRIIGRDHDNYFSGSFDGNGHVISNLTYIRTSGIGNNIGLFGYVRSFMGKAIIKDLGLIDPNIDSGGGNYVGSLIGILFDGSIIDCYVKGGNISGGDFTGGLVGACAQVSMMTQREIINCYCTSTISGNTYVGGLVGSYGGTITNCNFAGNIAGYEYVGGLLGESFCSEISNCYSTGMILGINQVGGLIGYIWGHDAVFMSTSSSRVIGFDQVGGFVGLNIYGEIFNCYSTGSVLGISKVAGLVGVNQGTVSNCYSAGIVEGTTDVGALVGSLNAHSFYPDGNVSNSFWDIETSEQPTSAGGTGETTAEMQSASTFLEAGWDFVEETNNGTEDIWRIYEGQDYPRLWWEKYGGGTGQPNDPYLIYTAEHMNQIGLYEEDWDKHFKLMADIDMSEFLFDKAVIAPDLNDATEDFEGIPFSGEFDGNNHRILNLTIDTQGNDRNYLGLFGSIAADGIIVNLGLEAVKIVGSGNRVHYPIVEFTGSFGGLCGINSGRIYSCWVNGSVTGGNYSEDIGGLCGCNKTRGSITYCYVTGCAEGGAGSGGIGGLCGSNEGTINNCRASSLVIGRNSLGGLCGYLDGGSIENSYSTGLVKGTSEYLGGLCGEVNWGTISNCFWDMETSGLLTSNGGIGKTTTEMQMASTFLEAGWDFVGETYNGIEDIWWILEGQDYPRLWWETK